MRYFYRLVEGALVMPIMASLVRHPFWKSDSTRMLLRDDLDDLPELREIAGAKKTALLVMQSVDGTALGSVSVLRVPARGKAELTRADGAVRYLVALHSDHGVHLTAGDETVFLHSGEIWWTDLALAGEIANNSDDDCVHLLVDVRIDA